MTRTTANLPYGQHISKLCFRCDSCFAFYENSFTDSIKSSCRISSPTIILNKNGNLWKYSGTALTNHFGHEIRNHPARSGKHVTFQSCRFRILYSLQTKILMRTPPLSRENMTKHQMMSKHLCFMQRISDQSGPSMRQTFHPPSPGSHPAQAQPVSGDRRRPRGQYRAGCNSKRPALP